ncbi:MAG: hypothetical protein JXA54_02410 [Candidatus Heimdallarchaeota archaeon]|nr:hypothetical protein [Candidatus Heimdallarchaeota archaeon]
MSLPITDIFSILGLSIIILVAAIMVYFILIEVYEIRKELAKKARSKIKAFFLKKNKKMDEEIKNG